MSAVQAPKGRDYYTFFDIRYSDGTMQRFIYRQAPEPQTILRTDENGIDYFDYNERERVPHMRAALNACIAKAVIQCPRPGSFRVYGMNPYYAIAGGVLL